MCSLCFETGASFSSASGLGTPSVAKTTELELEVIPHQSPKLLGSCEPPCLVFLIVPHLLMFGDEEWVVLP